MSAGTLPASAQPWRTWLDWFATPLAGAVNEMVRGLQPLLTPMRGSPQAGDAEPDGLDDLRRRGSYERLLPTEWLLAAELPDEFLRRAAAGEHLFFATRPRAERQRRRLVALFDAGPTQLGAPRLVHLALWILLARRAELAGAELTWGLLQEPGTVYQARNPADLKLLLAGRSWRVSGETELESWHEWLEQNRNGLAECWLTASRASVEAATVLGFSHALSVANSLKEGVLEVTLRDDAGRRSAQLDLPEAASAVALLNGRFETDARPGLQLGATAALSYRYAPVFSPDGRHVAVALKDQAGVAIYPIPSKSEGLPRPPLREQWAKRRQVLGITLSGRHVAALLREGDSLVFWRSRREYSAPSPSVDEFSAPPGTLAWRSCFVTTTKWEEDFFTLDAKQRLVFWARRFDQSSRLPARGPHLVQSNVLALAQNDPRTLHFIHRVGNRLQLFETRGTLGLRLLSTGLATVKAPDTVVFLAYLPGPAPQGSVSCLAAVREEFDPVEVWSVHLYQRLVSPQARVRLEPGERALGIVAGPAPGLLVLAPNRRQFYLVGEGGRETIYAAAQAVTRVSVCPVSGQMALLSADGSLIVYDLHGLSQRLSVAPRSGDWN